MTEYDPKRGVAVATLGYEYLPGFQVPEHAHGSDQLIYAISGLMEVRAGRSAWLIPPHFALWLPAGISHRISMVGAVSMRTLYVRTSGTAGPKPGVAVLHVSPLLRELILEAVQVGQLRMRDRYECALRAMLMAHVRKASSIPTLIMLPQEGRALAVAQAVLGDPGDAKSMAVLCAEAGVGVRTVQRVFRREVGIDFESWRRQVRLIKAVELLVSGYSIKETAARIGYCQSSAFVESFRRTFGTTPKAWVSALKIDGASG